MKRFFLHILFVIGFLSPVFFIHAESNSGFLNDTIWYSKDNFVEGDTIEIHTAVWNGEQSNLEGKVDFMDLNTIIGTRTINVAPHTLSDVFITWKVTAGDHTIKTLIRDTNLKANGKSTPIKFADTEQSLPKISISKKLSNVTKDASGLADSVSEKVKENLPTQVAEPVNKGIKSIDDFRVNTSDTITTMLGNTSKKLEELNSSASDSPDTNKKDTKKTDTKIPDTKKVEVKEKPLAGTEKPIAYVELFLLTVVSFIFKNSVVFYLLCGFLLFIILRFIYRKIRK